MDNYSENKIKQTRLLQNRIKQIREEIGGDYIPWTRIKRKSKSIKKNNPQPPKPITPHWTSCRHLTPDKKKYINDNKLRINGECAELIRQINWAKEYPYNDRQQAVLHIKKKILDLIEDNKDTFGYDRHSLFTEKQIEDKIKWFANDLFREAVATGQITYDEDNAQYIDESGCIINELDFKYSSICREAAKNSLLEEYDIAHKVGHDCNERIRRAELLFTELEHSITVREQFRKTISQTNAITLYPYILKHHDHILTFLDNELSHYSKPQGKSIAILLIVLNKAGYMVDWNRKLSQILSAFRDRYGDKIGSQKNIEDYLRGYRNRKYSDKNITPSEIQEIEDKLNQAI